MIQGISYSLHHNPTLYKWKGMIDIKKQTQILCLIGLFIICWQLASWITAWMFGYSSPMEKSRMEVKKMMEESEADMNSPESNTL